MYGMTTSMPSSFLPGMSERTISQPSTAPSGTDTSTVNSPMISEFFSGTHSVADARLLEMM